MSIRINFSDSQRWKRPHTKDTTGTADLASFVDLVRVGLGCLGPYRTNRVC